jgi:hypothetical protein
MDLTKVVLKLLARLVSRFIAGARAWTRVKRIDSRYKLPNGFDGSKH